jgi:hypothetical protein
MTMSRAEARKQNLAQRDRSDTIEGVFVENDALTAQAAIDKDTIEQRDLAIIDLNRQVADLTHQLADCQAGHDPQTKTLWGANPGGYASQGETQAAAWSRITAGFGKINVVRWWPNAFFQWSDLPAYYGDAAVVANLGSDLAGILSGAHDAAMLAICAQATRPTWLTGLHEPEDDGFILADWQAAQVHLASLKAEAGNPLVKFGPLLMGASYHATRYQGTGPNPIPASQWLDFDRSNCDFIGGDFYQWGKSDADADHAETVIGPARDLALSYGKHLVAGELGARRRSTVSDAIRKRWITETAAIITANPGLIDAICYYETDRGAVDKVPWCLLPPPGQDPNDPANSPLAVAAYRALCLA